MCVNNLDRQTEKWNLSPPASAGLSLPMNLSRAENPSRTAISECAKSILHSASAVGEDGGVEPRVPLPSLAIFLGYPLFLGDGGRVGLVPAGHSHRPGTQVPPGAFSQAKTIKNKFTAAPPWVISTAQRPPASHRLHVHLLLIN